MVDKKEKQKKIVNKAPVSPAHNQADKDIQKDPDLSNNGPEEELDEGELARFEARDDGEMDLSKENI